MYNSYSKELLNLIPNIEGIDKNEIVRYLSKAFLFSFNENSRNEVSSDEKQEIRNYLRKLINFLEHETIFNNQERDIIISSSFFAAEALSLLLKFNEELDDVNILELESRISAILYLQVEIALLYFISHNTVNAISILKQIKLPNIEEENRFSSISFIANLINFLNGDLEERSYSRPQNEDANTVNELINFTYCDFIYDLHTALENYKSWFVGRNSDGLDRSKIIIRKIINTLEESTHILFEDISHLSNMLLVTIESSMALSFRNKMIDYEFDNDVFQSNYIDYINRRTLGATKFQARPFLWPPAVSYIDTVFFENISSVISIPTGSGKSFLAEISVIEALKRGWVLYLAPTNALCNQIYFDLKASLVTFNNIEVKRFLGYSEYSGDQNEFLELEEAKFVAVMTPEKCSLALRLYPEVFSNCSLCVFDEFHLINEKNRGLNLDIVLSLLVQNSTNLRFVLMSAMISNPEFLAGWLKEITNANAEIFTLKWKPTRSLRGLLIIDKNSLESEFESAKVEADNLQGSLVNKKFNVDLGLLAGLSGPWSTERADYKLVKIQSTFACNASKRSNHALFPSWKNKSAIILSKELSKSVSTICFILTQKHHVFSSATNAVNGQSNNTEFPELINAYKIISEVELGVNSEVFSLLEQGISVHSSAMLASEQFASEYFFKNGFSNLMFATPTLAQGLNMPSIAVVIAGSSLGDPRDADAEFYHDKVNSLILNCFGRGGRAGFANQGIAFLITDKPYSADFGKKINGSAAILEYPVLAEQDASILIRSPLEQFINNILSDDYDLKSDKNELALNCLLSDYKKNGISIKSILSKTLGGFSQQNILTDTDYQKINKVVDSAGNLAEESENPEEWYSSVAMKSGSSIDKVVNMWEALQKVQASFSDITVIIALKVLIDTLSKMSPVFVNSYFADEEQKTQTVFTALRDLSIRGEESTTEWYSNWQIIFELVKLYMQGKEYSVIARLIFNIQSEKISTGRSAGGKPIPSVFKFIDKVIFQLAIDAGCLLAIVEQTEEIIPEELSKLPTAVRYGCNSISCLSWFQYGYRQRSCAHILSEKFPIPTEVQNGKDWVINKRREWLANENDEENPILQSIKTIVSS